MNVLIIDLGTTNTKLTIYNEVLDIVYEDSRKVNIISPSKEVMEMLQK